MIILWHVPVQQNQLQLTDAVTEVRHAISRLIVNPPDFNQVMVRLIDLFSTKVLDETTLAAVVEEIFVQVQVDRLDGCALYSDVLKLSWLAADSADAALTKCFKSIFLT